MSWLVKLERNGVRLTEELIAAAQTHSVEEFSANDRRG